MFWSIELDMIHLDVALQASTVLLALLKFTIQQTRMVKVH